MVLAQGERTTQERRPLFLVRNDGREALRVRSAEPRCQSDTRRGAKRGDRSRWGTVRVSRVDVYARRGLAVVGRERGRAQAIEPRDGMYDVCMKSRSVPSIGSCLRKLSPPKTFQPSLPRLPQPPRMLAV